MKTITLEQFTKDAHEQVDLFEQYWRANHETTPDLFPMEIPEDNVGILWEQLSLFEH